jgi:CHAT domain-containing protein/tetratricopeptide (TPR) repeat protein
MQETRQDAGVAGADTYRRSVFPRAGGVVSQTQGARCGDSSACRRGRLDRQGYSNEGSFSSNNVANRRDARAMVPFPGLTRAFQIRFLSCFVLLCLLVIAMAPQLNSAQSGNDPQQLQKSGVARIDHWTDYVRRTGDAKSTVSELAAAQFELKASYDLFMQRQDFTGASWSAIKLGDIQRFLNQWGQGVPLYKSAIDLAGRANRTDYQTKALARLAFSELKINEADAAEEHIREALRLGANSGNKNFFFEALDVASQIEVARGNLAAAAENLDRALSMSNQIDDKRQLYFGYADRGEIYYQIALKCDYQRTFDVCYHSLELARVDYEKAIALARELGYEFVSQSFQTIVNGLDERKALIEKTQSANQRATDSKLFSPQTPKDVLVTEHFTFGAMDPATIAPLENELKQVNDWQARLQQQGLFVQDLNPSDLCLQGQLEEDKGNDDAALAAFQQADDLLEKDRRKLGDEQARGAFLNDKIDCFYHPALLLLDRKRYSEAFSLFERSRSRVMADLLAGQPLTLGNAQEQTLYSQLQTLRLNIAAKQEKLFDLTGSQKRDQNVKLIAQLESEIDNLQQQFYQLEARIGKQAPNLKQLTAAEPVTLETVQRSAAQEGYDVLYYVVMSSELVLWHINGSEVQVKNVFLPHVQLTKKTTSLRDSLVARRDAPDAKFDEETSRQLFLYLIQPVLSSLKGNHLIIVPQEELNSIPFQALQNPATGRYLGESFAISYAPSATVLASLGNKSPLKNGRLLAVADPEIHDAIEEVDAIGRLYPGRSKVVTQSAVNKADIKAWVGDYSVVHLSVHGMFNISDPLLSYLQFKAAPPDTGRLSAAEMFGLPLQKNSLVVLSACETGRVEDTHANEVLGMVRSLLYAGAGNLVLSSWEVNARSTKLWMETFYREGQTYPPAEAARQALIAVKSQPEYSHPFYWAPFVMTGK